MLELRADTVSHSPLGAKLPSVRQEFVCLNCFGNPGLRVWVADNELDSEEYHDPHCDFCKPENSSPVLADLSEVGGYVLECVEARYADPAEELPYETAEGGYQGEVIDAYDVLDCAELDLPNDSTGKLRDLIADHLSEHDWCEKDYFALREDEALRYSWDSYVRVSKEGTVLEFMYGENPGDREEIPPAELLEWLTERAYEFGLVKPLRVGHNLYRVRFQNPGERHRTADELGPPPSYLAKQPNRLNPRHTEMMYASDDAATALAETVVGKGAYAVGEFSVLDELRVLDLTDLPEPICFFDLDNANVRASQLAVGQPRKRRHRISTDPDCHPALSPPLDNRGGTHPRDSLHQFPEQRGCECWTLRREHRPLRYTSKKRKETDTVSVREIVSAIGEIRRGSALNRGDLTRT
jgi:hypothetical protein